MEKPWKADFDELDTEIIGAQTMAAGSFMAPLAIALALIDKGLIDKNRLLEIIESLQVMVPLDYEDRLGEAEDATLSLRDMSAMLSCSEWKPGEVVEYLHTLENAGLLALQIRQAKRKPDRQ